MNKNVSVRQPKLSSEVLSKLQLLRIVSRFHNSRQQQGNQRAQAWQSFGYLFCVVPSEDGLETPDSQPVRNLYFKVIYCLNNIKVPQQMIERPIIDDIETRVTNMMGIWWARWKVHQARFANYCNSSVKHK